MGQKKTLATCLTGLILTGCTATPEKRFIVDEEHPMKYENILDAKGVERKVPMIYDSQENKYVAYLGEGIRFK